LDLKENLESLERMAWMERRFQEPILRSQVMVDKQDLHKVEKAEPLHLAPGA
jgi:hypothetical protein